MSERTQIPTPYDEEVAEAEYALSGAEDREQYQDFRRGLAVAKAKQTAYLRALADHGTAPALAEVREALEAVLTEMPKDGDVPKMAELGMIDRLSYAYAVGRARALLQRLGGQA